MHCVFLADIAALLAHHGPGLLGGGQTVPAEAVMRYWCVCRQRFDLWHHALGRYRQQEKHATGAQLSQWWNDNLPMLEEVLVGEILSRVYAALAETLDRSRDESETGPVVRSVYLTHLEARNRVLHLMVYGRGGSIEQAVRLNRLRREVERWVDAILGRMAWEDPGPLAYAFDADRAAEHARDARTYGVGPARQTTQWLMQVTMHDAIRRRTSAEAALPEANRQVAESVMLGLRPDLFDSVGMLKSLWLHRLQVCADQTDRVLTELLAADLDQGETLSGYQQVRDPNVIRWLL